MATCCDMAVTALRDERPQKPGDALRWRKLCVEAMQRATTLKPLPEFINRLRYYQECAEDEQASDVGSDYEDRMPYMRDGRNVDQGEPGNADGYGQETTSQRTQSPDQAPALDAPPLPPQEDLHTSALTEDTNCREAQDSSQAAITKNVSLMTLVISVCVFSRKYENSS